MPSSIVMPKLGMTMQEGTVIDWPIAIGSRVEKGEIVLIIESEKAEVEVEATEAGFFRHTYVNAEEAVPCGTLLCADGRWWRGRDGGKSAPVLGCRGLGSR